MPGSSRTVLRLSRRRLWDHRVRYGLVALALAVGVASTTGVVLLADSLGAVLQRSSGETHAGVDLQVRRRTTMPLGFDFPEAFPAALTDQLRGVEGVEAANPGVIGEAPLVKPGDSHINAPGIEIGVSWDPDPRTSQLQVVAGHAPGPGEITLDESTARDHHLVLPQRLGVQTEHGVQWFELVGLHRVGASNVTAGSSIAAMSLPDAQRVLRREGEAQLVSVVVRPGTDSRVVADRLAAIVPPDVEVVAGTIAASDSIAPLQGLLADTTVVMVGFAAISSVVAALLVHATFSLVLQQRSREVAMVRAIGATRRQMRVGLLVESAVVGLVASLVGVLLAPFVARGLAALIDLRRIGMDRLDLVVSARALAVALLAGVAVSMASAWGPVRRATASDVVAVLRGEVAADRRGWRGPVTAAGPGLVGLAAIVWAAVTHPPALMTRFAVLGLGALLLSASVGGVATVLSARSVRLIGAPFARLWGTPGRLARDNTSREHARTSRLSVALMIGLAFVASANVVGGSIRESLASGFRDSVRADLYLSGPTPREGVGEMKTLPQVRAVLGFGWGHLGVDGASFKVWGTDLTQLRDFTDLDLRSGSIDPGRPDGVLVPAEDADRLGLSVGDAVVASSNAHGSVTFSVMGVYRNTNLVDGLVVGDAAFARTFDDPIDRLVLVQAAPGVGRADARAAVHSISSRYPAVELWKDGEYELSQRQEVDAVLSIVRVLLGVALLAALIGIANTLALSAAQRTREFGLLRAVGMTARQLRQMVRSEAAIVGVFGMVLGLGLGVATGLAIVVALPPSLAHRITVPTGDLAELGAVAVALAVVASVVPAQRSTRLRVLDALHR